MNLEFVKQVKEYIYELGFGYEEIGLIFSLKTFEFKKSGFINELYLTDEGLMLSKASIEEIKKHKEAANWDMDLVVEYE